MILSICEEKKKNFEILTPISLGIMSSIQFKDPNQVDINISDGPRRVWHWHGSEGKVWRHIYMPNSQESKSQHYLQRANLARVPRRYE